MSEGIEGILIFGVVSVICSLLSHYAIRAYVFASIIAAIFTAVALQVVFYFELGYVDAFFQIAMVTSGLMAFVVALIIGIPFRRKRKYKTS